MKKPDRIYIRVSFELPEEATVDDAKSYVLDAVKSHCGSLENPGDPMVYLRRESVRVQQIRNRRISTSGQIG